MTEMLKKNKLLPLFDLIQFFRIYHKLIRKANANNLSFSHHDSQTSLISLSYIFLAVNV